MKRISYPTSRDSCALCVNRSTKSKKVALENLVNQRLLEAEAKKQGLTADEFLQKEVDSKIAPLTDVELKSAYDHFREKPDRPFEEVKPQLQQTLNQLKVQQSRQEYFAHLRGRAKISILLNPPLADVGPDSSRIRGNPKARVIIVEFSDFQCPYCSKVQATLRNLLIKYEGKVALSFRDMPVEKLHPRALSAAEAARCAGDQGKFWEYHDVLFSDQSKLDNASLVDKARALKLDDTEFATCLAGERHKTEIALDYQDGLRAGVSGTPGFFINGVYVDGNQPEDTFDKVIQEQLAKPAN
jgi:protein-disulfide isomerase